MPSPSSSLATLRPDLAGSLEEFNLLADRMGFIAPRVLPVIEVMKQSGNFGIIPVEQLLGERSTARASGSGYSRGSWKFEPGTYATEEHGWEEPIDDREAAQYRDYFDAEVVSTQRALDAVLRNAEIRAADLLFNATTWAAHKTAVTNEWDDAANATPITDVHNGKKAIYAASGMWPNALIVNVKVAENLAMCDQIVDRSKSQGFMDVRKGAITHQQLAMALGIEELIVAGAPKNTANDGQAVSLSPIWSDEYAMLAVVARTADPREVCVGRTFHWAEDGSAVGGTVETYRDETIRGDVVRVRHDVDEKVRYVQCAHLFENITT